jgi:hypothetical protein
MDSPNRSLSAFTVLGGVTLLLAVVACTWPLAALGRVLVDTRALGRQAWAGLKGGWLEGRGAAVLRARSAQTA